MSAEDNKVSSGATEDCDLSVHVAGFDLYGRTCGTAHISVWVHGRSGLGCPRY
jgi:hypothetical protein